MNSKSTYDHAYFDALYALNQGDPWHYEQRWYEQRKRQICKALLPKLHFESAIEIGCSNGMLSQELAPHTENSSVWMPIRQRSGWRNNVCKIILMSVLSKALFRKTCQSVSSS
jgi:Nodulation protein S (NodS).